MRVRPHVQAGFDFRLEVGEGAGRWERGAGRAGRVRHPGEFVQVAAGPETETRDQLHRRVGGEDGDGKNPARLDILVGKVLFIEADGQPGGI